jgi:dihydropteroate synthase
MNHQTELQGALRCAAFLSTKRPLQMAILNVSPDSFSDGGLHTSVEAAEAQAQMLIASGADIIDVGGVSTRPGAPELATDDELERIMPVLRNLRAKVQSKTLVSLDTSNPLVAEAAGQEGLIDVINDVYAARKSTRSGSHDRTTAHIAAQFGLGLVLMHMQGTPATMQTQPTYSNCLDEVITFLNSRLDFAKMCGVKWCAVDPGIGFGKLLEHNLQLLSKYSFEKIQELGAPILIGLSRKSFLKQLADRQGVLPAFSTLDEENNWRDQQSAQWEHNCAQWGASVIRTHKIKNTL